MTIFSAFVTLLPALPHRIIAVLLVAVSAVSATEVVQEVPRNFPSPEPEHYKVHLLVARHGLSCTNVVQKWISSFDGGRRNIRDPLLSGTGLAASREMSGSIASWLKEHNHTMDLVLSSPLARAMATGLQLSAGGASPLYVAPYIMESNFGFASNVPLERENQTRQLVEAFGSDIRVSYRWTNVFGQNPGSWDDFVHFLEGSLLPELLEQQPRPTGSPVVLAVVTHSPLISKGEVGTRCSHTWTSRKFSGPLNNQVLDVPYTFTIRRPAAGSFDSTTHYSLSPKDAETGEEQPCSQVAAGAQEESFRRDKLCLSDIGAACIGPVVRHAWGATKLFKHTAEGTILRLANRIARMTTGEWGANGLASSMSISDPSEDDLEDAYRGRIETALNVQCQVGGKPDPRRFIDLQLPTGEAIPTGNPDVDRRMYEVIWPETT